MNRGVDERKEKGFFPFVAVGMCVQQLCSVCFDNIQCVAEAMMVVVVIRMKGGESKLGTEWNLTKVPKWYADRIFNNGMWCRTASTENWFTTEFWHFSGNSNVNVRHTEYKYRVVCSHRLFEPFESVLGTRNIVKLWSNTETHHCHRNPFFFFWFQIRN